MNNNITYSIIITAWKEPKTIGPLINSIEKQISNDRLSNFEIILVCPDEETKISGLKFDKLGIVKWLKDSGEGKPLALNHAFRNAKGSWCITTDGDVLWEDHALRNLLTEIEKGIWGAISGHPIPVNDRNNKFGFWSHLLTEMAHRQRLERSLADRSIICSGYLMAIEKRLFKDLPKDVLSDDALISYTVINKNKKIGYAKDALVYVKFPNNFRDWMKQKIRSGGGYAQLSQFIKIPKDRMRSITNEILGFWDVVTYPKFLKEFTWMIELLFARLYLWIKSFWERKVLNKSFEKTWVRVESTK
jgi:cellulose synthase/poly-beta-1,6-N-acetylglucosamine synthase-like glycosyltransferase